MAAGETTCVESALKMAAECAGESLRVRKRSCRWWRSSVLSGRAE